MTPCVADVDGAHSRIEDHPRAGGRRHVEQVLVEHRAIDDERLGRGRGVGNRQARGREEARGGQRVENRRPRQAELLECLDRQDAGAVHGLAGRRVFLDNDDVETRRASRVAVYRPPGPPPTTITSCMNGLRVPQRPIPGIARTCTAGGRPICRARTGNGVSRTVSSPRLSAGRAATLCCRDVPSGRGR